jgi:hypothetical protein
LAELFDEIVHVAPVSTGPAPPSSLPYRSPRVRVRAVRPAGGEGFRAKLGIAAAWPLYAFAILKELRRAKPVSRGRIPFNDGGWGGACIAPK